MPRTHTKRIEQLTGLIQPVLADDTMPEAGRKILRVNFLDMIKHEAGLEGEDPVDNLHQMRVAARRLRSAFLVLESYYERKTIRSFIRTLKTTGRALGDVRDLDVMTDNFKSFFGKQTGADAATLEKVLAPFEKRRSQAREALYEWLDSEDYRQFVKKFTSFLSEPGEGSRPPDSKLAPYQARHVAPVIFHQHLANVRAFDQVLPTEKIQILHALRIEFKRLRYVLTFFSEIMGASISDFIDEIKAVQEHLGNLNDAVVGREQFDQPGMFAPEQEALVNTYRDLLAEQAKAGIAAFEDVWAHFNTRAVQRKFSDALLVVR
jgi:CHAD domain-containing protein